MAGRYAAYRRADDTISPEVVDRLMIGVCAAVWLIWLGASVVAENGSEATPFIINFKIS